MKGEGRVRILAIALTGFVMAPVLAWNAMTLVASAWGACGDAEPPYLGALLFLDLPFTVLEMWFLWSLTMLVTRARSILTAVLLPLGLCVLVAWAVVADHVPINEPSYYADLKREIGAPLDQCQATGIPTWWPAWLPI